MKEKIIETCTVLIEKTEKNVNESHYFRAFSEERLG